MIPSQFAPRRGARVLVIFPGALGDFLCLLPSLEGLRVEGTETIGIVARRDWLGLVDGSDYEQLSIESRAMAELFGVGGLENARALMARFTEVHSWTGHGEVAFERLLREANPASTSLVHPFRDFGPREHASDYYARCLGVRARPFRLRISPEQGEWAASFCARVNPENRAMLAVHAGSGSPRKNWDGFQALAERWQRQGGVVVEVRGRADDAVPRLRDPQGVLESEALPRVAALLSHAQYFAGNDSGIAHLAAACGSRGVVLFGRSSSVEHWCPQSTALRVVRSRVRCSKCGEIGLCSDCLTAERVWEALQLTADTADRRSCSSPRDFELG